MITSESVSGTVPNIRSEVRSFVALLLLQGDCLPVPITPEDAAYDMSNWVADDVEYPAGMTPELFAEVWNELLK